MSSIQSARTGGESLESVDPKRRRRDAEVLKAATGVFYRRGYANATVQDVADSLGMLKGSLYYYIKSKEELLFRIATNVHDDVDVLMAEVMQEEGLSALERIRDFVRRQVAYNVDNLEEISVYHHDTHHLGKALRTDIGERWQRHQAFLIALIQEAQADGDVDPEVNAELLSHCVFAPVIWMYRWYGRSSAVSVTELQDACVSFVTSGIEGRPPEGSGLGGEASQER